MPTRSSASSSCSVPTSSVPRPRWLWVASGTSSRIRSTSSSSNPASSRRSAARPRTRPCAHGQALMPVASTPTTRRDAGLASRRRCRSARPSPASRRPVTGVVRAIGQRAAIRTSARSALCRSTMWRAMCSASSSTSSASPSTTSSIASSNSSGKRDMWTPFWPRSRSTVQSISAAITASRCRRADPDRLVRRRSRPRARGRAAPPAPTPGDRSTSRARDSAMAATLAPAWRPTDPTSPGWSRSRATTCGRRSRPCTGSRGHSCGWSSTPEQRDALRRHDRRRLGGSSPS